MQAAMDAVLAHPLYAQYDAWAQETGKEVLTWANPGMDLAARPDAVTQAPMASFGAMFAWVLVYAVIVFIGMVLYVKPKKSSGKRKAPPTWEEVAASFVAEPVKVLQALYNIVQIALCGWMVVAAVKAAIDQKYNVVCNSFNTQGSDVTFVLWVFYVSKILDFFDTLFMVLRGKWAQFSFLHIYHHFSIFFVYWVNFNVAYDGDIYFTIVANGFIHFVMYYYYLLTTFGARPWWAAHLTSLQMVQFLCMMTQALFLLNDPACAEFPRPVVLFYFFYILSLFLLFAHFFVQRYLAGGKKVAKGGKAKAE